MKTRAEEFLELQLRLGMQAYDLSPVPWPSGPGYTRDEIRSHFEANLRERLAQAAQVYACDVGAAEEELRRLVEGLSKDDEPRRQAIARAKAFLKEVGDA